MPDVSTGYKLLKTPYQNLKKLEISQFTSTNESVEQFAHDMAIRLYVITCSFKGQNGVEYQFWEREKTVIRIFAL